jgi:hypothetical protein
MTQQYIAGELSSLVAELGLAVGKFGGAVSSLRQEIEMSLPCRLPPLAGEALDLANRLCWVALEEGDVASFRRRAQTTAALCEFATSANLLP